MVIKKELGQIQEVRFGHGGYQDVQMGLWLVMGKKGGGWGVSTSINAGWSRRRWTMSPSSRVFQLKLRSRTTCSPAGVCWKKFFKEK